MFELANSFNRFELTYTNIICNMRLGDQRLKTINALIIDCTERFSQIVYTIISQKYESETGESLYKNERITIFVNSKDDKLNINGESWFETQIQLDHVKLYDETAIDPNTGKLSSKWEGRTFLDIEVPITRDMLNRIGRFEGLSLSEAFEGPELDPMANLRMRILNE